MNILVTGATGFIASQIITDLITAGHTVTCCARNTIHAQTLFPNTTIFSCDFVKDTSPEVWLPRLKNIDIVINCVGIFYHPNKNIIWAIHYETPKALFDACVKVGVKKIIHISALGVNKVNVDYANSKQAADDYLLNLSIPAIILRPSLVYSKGTYGGTSLFRGLAGLPWITPVPGGGKQLFQPIHLQDLSRAVIRLLDNPSNKSIIFHAVSSQAISLKEMLIQTRSWLGLTKSFLLFVPMFFIKMGCLLGNFIPNSSLNETAYRMMQLDNITTPEEAKKFHDAITLTPRNFIAGLNSQPSTVQDHWHAKLFFLKPLLQISIAFFWLWIGLCGLFLYPKINLYQLLTKIGVSDLWQPFTLYATSLFSVGLGLATLLNYQIKKIGILQIIFILFSSSITTWNMPYLWLDPLDATLTKNIPLLAATLILLALESDR